jgi:hypothetical protein
MAAPYMTAASWPKIDLAGEIIFDTLALIGIFLLGKQVFARAGIAKVNTSRE